MSYRSQYFREKFYGKRKGGLTSFMSTPIARPLGPIFEEARKTSKPEVRGEKKGIL
jgi:hypothetical protein